MSIRKDILVSEADIDINQPQWYSQRTILSSIADYTEDGKLNLSKCSAGFAVGDTLLFVKLDAVDAPTNDAVAHATVKEAVGQILTLDAIPTLEGKVLVLKAFHHALESADGTKVSAKEWVFLPVTYEMITEDQKASVHTLEKLGLVSPGWYRWMWYTQSNGKSRYIAELLVGMKNIQVDKSGLEGFSIEADDSVVTLS